MAEKTFWGYNNKEEALRYFPYLNKGEFSVKKKIVCSRDKKCIGSHDGIEFMYDDGYKDKGIEIEEVSVILGDNLIRF
jgi:hypothetical protein